MTALNTIAEFPTFLDYFRQIREVDQAYASKCIAHWRLFMQGPPNKPNNDEIGLINVSIDFLCLVSLLIGLHVVGCVSVLQEL